MCPEGETNKSERGGILQLSMQKLDKTEFQMQTLIDIRISI
jgi:hypothetical protein